MNRSRHPHAAWQGLVLSLLLCVAAYAQITPSADSYTNTADPTTNYGAKTLLDVDGAKQTTYIQFNLASIPSGASISQATLKLFVNSVTTAGSFNVDYVNSAWSESTIDASNAPPLGGTVASNVDVTTADKNQYILINVTAAVQAWLSGSETNNGLALVATSTFNATFDSKENTTTSHPAELDIAFAGGDGTITGVTTAAGSGLTGGGTSGTLNLSLTNSCAANQVLQWNGSAWACAAAGTGTITGVAAGTDLTGGGTSGNVTLNLDTTKVPLLNAANRFAGSQTVNGNLTATGIVTGSSYQIGSNLFAFGSYANENAFFGFAGNTSTTGVNNTASGYQALNENTTGLDNTASGEGALFANSTGNFNTALGDSALVFTTTGSTDTGVGVNSGSTVDLSSMTGSNNTFLGANSAVSTGNLSNATAIGAYAEVNASNSLVLGSINGVNGAKADTSVGIGTAAPATRLDIVAQGLHTYIGGACDTTGYGGIAFGSSGFQACATYSLMGDGTNTYINAPNSSLGSIYFRLSNQSSPSAMVISDTVFDEPLVGIGTISPDNTLSVNGTADKPGGGSWGTFSDRRLKNLSGSFNSGLEQVLKLQPIRYRYKDDNGMGIRDRAEHVGFVAQEVRKVIPEAVTENNKGYLLVNNDPIIWTMLNAIKEQQKLIRKQQSQIARLSSQVKAIEASLKTSGRTRPEVHTTAVVSHK